MERPVAGEVAEMGVDERPLSGTYVEGYDLGGQDGIRRRERRYPRLTRRQRVSWKYLGSARAGYDDGYEDGSYRSRDRA